MNKVFIAAIILAILFVLLRRRQKGCRRCLGRKPCALCTCTNMN
jgi:hypothetical protein